MSFIRRPSPNLYSPSRHILYIVQTVIFFCLFFADNTNDRLLEPYDTPISAGTIRAVVVVGLITLFVASFLYWQSWKERHKKPPCVTKLKQGISDVVNAQCSRVRANRARADAGLRLDETRQGTISAGDRLGQRGHNSGAIPGRIKPEILRHSPVPSLSSSTSCSPSTSSSIYHSPASSQMIVICETFKPTKENVGEMLTVAQSPRGYNLGTYRTPSEQLILHV